MALTRARQRKTRFSSYKRIPPSSPPPPKKRLSQLALEGGHEHVGEKLTPTSSVFGSSIQSGSIHEDRVESPPCQSPEYADHGRADHDNSTSFVGGSDTANDVPSLRREDPLLSSCNAEMYPATPEYKRHCHNSSGSGTSSYLSDYRTPTTTGRAAAGRTEAAAAAVAAQQTRHPDIGNSAVEFPLSSQAEALAAAAVTVASQSAAATAIAHGRAISEEEGEMGRRFSAGGGRGSVSSYAAIITPTTIDQGGNTATFDGNASGFPPLRRRRRERCPFDDGGGFGIGGGRGGDGDTCDYGLNSPSSSMEHASEGRGGAVWTGNAARDLLGREQQETVGFSAREQAADGRQLNEHRDRQYQQQCQQNQKCRKQYQQLQQLQQQKRQQQQDQQQQQQRQLQCKQQYQQQQEQQQQQQQQQQHYQQQQRYRRLREENPQVPLVWPEHSPNLNPIQPTHTTPQRSSIINATAITHMADLMGTHEPAHSETGRLGKSTSHMTADDFSSLGDRGDKTHMTADDLSLLGERGDQTYMTADDLSLLGERGGKTDMTAEELSALGELVFGNSELYAAATAAHANSKDAIDTTIVGGVGDALGRHVEGGGEVDAMHYTDIDSLLWDDEEEEETRGPFAVPRLDSDWCNYEGY